MHDVSPRMHPSGEDDPHAWLNAGLLLLQGGSEGLEGVIRLQQASLSFDQALRCGLPRELLTRSLRNRMAQQLEGLRTTMNQI